MRGQLAIGIAFAFTAFLAMFGLVFNSSWVVREKMQLQQATDYAALRGSYVQKVNLEHIRELNQKIQDLYTATEIALKVPYCWQIIAAAGGSCQGTPALSNAITGKASTTCTDACSNYESFVRNQILNTYSNLHKNLVAQILTSLTQANDIAFEESKAYFFSKKNTPYGLRNLLRKKLGDSFSAVSARTLYNNGSLDETIALYNGQGFDLQPDRFLLFDPKAEQKLLTYMNYTYAPGTPGPYCACIPAPVGGWPLATLTTRKIARSGDEHTTFLLGAEYKRPMTDVERTFKLGVFALDDKKAATASTGEEARLFAERTYPMMAWSMAKPFGGKYPKAGQMATFDPGEVGEDFKGIKLIGIADRAEQGTKLRSLALSGERYGMGPITMEEFLH